MPATAEEAASLRRSLLGQLYCRSVATKTSDRLELMLASHDGPELANSPWSERDAWLITYPDQFQEPEVPPLRALPRFVEQYAPWLTGIHVLPFYPWSSDDGFSVIDYAAVDVRYGNWGDIEAISRDKRLIVDAVINHMSTQSDWFRRFLADEPAYRSFFRTADPDADLSSVVRPRTTPLLTPFEGAGGTEYVWTTFSADQADLDYRNPEVLLRIIAVLLDYVRHGANVLRLDAIALLWKEEGTSSMHLPETHAVIKLIRSCLDSSYPGTLVLTETNVPHAENVSYFGDGSVPEAHVVYQFALAPLTLHALVTGETSVLERWAAELVAPFPGTTFLNFLGSHDGVGVRPAEGLLTREAIMGLADHSRAAGGGVGERTLEDGTIVPYELHCTWFDLVALGVSHDDAIARHLASHAVLLALAGIPALYVHSLFGSSNDHEGLAATGRGRTLNRHKFADMDALRSRLADSASREARVLAGLAAMVSVRARHPAFRPGSSQAILESPPGVLSVDRTADDGAVANVTINLGPNAVDYLPPGRWMDAYSAESPLPTLAPWSSRWVVAPKPDGAGASQA